MKGRAEFSKTEVDGIRRLLREKQTADRDTQKRVRGNLRRLPFYISDFASDQEGFTAADFDILIARGVIRVIPD
jgi:hypothetical protein